MCQLANNTFDMELSVVTYFKMMRLIQVIAKLVLTESDYNKILHMEVPLNYKDSFKTNLSITNKKVDDDSKR